MATRGSAHHHRPPSSPLSAAPLTQPDGVGVTDGEDVLASPLDSVWIDSPAEDDEEPDVGPAPPVDAAPPVGPALLRALPVVPAGSPEEPEPSSCNAGASSVASNASLRSVTEGQMYWVFVPRKSVI